MRLESATVSHRPDAQNVAESEAEHHPRTRSTWQCRSRDGATCTALPQRDVGCRPGPGTRGAHSRSCRTDYRTVAANRLTVTRAVSCGFSCGARYGKAMNRVARVSARSSAISKLQLFQRLADGLEWILSPLRLPVPPSRHFLEAIDFTACSLFLFLLPNNKCEAV